MALPPSLAGPNAVRAYLTSILISKHDAAPERAQQIAGLWELGCPNDLRHASLERFKELFGKEVGTILFRTVQEEIRTEYWGSIAGILSNCM